MLGGRRATMTSNREFLKHTASVYTQARTCCCLLCACHPVFLAHISRSVMNTLNAPELLWIRYTSGLRINDSVNLYNYVLFPAQLHSAQSHSHRPKHCPQPQKNLYASFDISQHSRPTYVLKTPRRKMYL